jgi:hypothetical protein
MKNQPTVEGLLKNVQQAGTLSPYPMSLYTALLSCWQEQAYNIPFRVTRKRLMALSGIRSIATYHECIKVLINRRYILYEPSFSKRTASQVTLLAITTSE